MEPTVEAGLHLSGDVNSRTCSNEKSVFSVMKLDIFHFFVS
jgi:hypothetical protein